MLPNLFDTQTEGNVLSNKLKKLIILSQVDLTQQLYALYHHNSVSLRKQLRLAWKTASQIVKQCEIYP